MNLHLNATIGHAEVLQEVQSCDTGTVLRGVLRQFAVITGDLGDMQAGFIAVADDDFIARRIDGETEHVVTAGNIGHRGGGEYANFRRVGHKKGKKKRSRGASGVCA